ncbi:zinc-dependent peptidase [Chitinophaga sp. YR573]|uniref:M90 family metallopeptidase n=1 Tax=Chitinophaga sp. YR573 TaxID=1881040 RepID=UPI000B7E5FED|nr:M90 family metallopeptidase [Chitinophaga sp. YR573]
MTAIIIIALMIILGGYFPLRKRNRNKPSEDAYKVILNEHIEYYQKLDDGGKARFEKLVKEFLNVTHIEGVGTEITDVDRVMVASGAVIPIFGFPSWKYRNLTNVILYPDTFNHEYQFEGGDRNILGMVGSGYMNGQMLLSRAALVKGFSKSSGAENTAIHEFVHLLDMSDGATDGIPQNLMKHEYTIPWLKMIHHEMQRIEAGHSDINPYAVTNEAEFLAVASEYFFQKPGELKQHHPEIYEQLSRIFGQTPEK